jgi:hypothetical protein
VLVQTARLVLTRLQTVKVVAVVLAEATVPSSVLGQPMSTTHQTAQSRVTSAVELAHPTSLEMKFLRVAAEQ